ncbi:MAG: selenide, water dikinase SelD [Hyphomicrobiaceae bacterium]
MQPTPVLKDLVLVGGGHAHVHVISAFAMRPVPGVRLTVVTRDVVTPYSGMLPGLISGHYTYDQCHIDLAPLARRANARLYHDRVTALDLDRKLVICEGRPPVPYDVLSIDIGSTPRANEVPGASEWTTPVKPIDGLYGRWQAIVERARKADGPRRFLTVGGGAAGVEVTLAMRHRLRAILAEDGRDPDALSFTLVTRDALLGTHNAAVRAKFARILSERGVTVRTGSGVAEVREGEVRLSDGTAIAFDEALWVTQAGAAPWLRETGLALDDNGFIAVDETLQSISTPGVFAAGDIAGNMVHPRPKAGVFAVRQGPPLADNLRRALIGEPLKAFRPQRDFLSLISAGDRYAVASRGGFCSEGAWVWRLKDRIDRRWMERYQILPDMQPMAPPATAHDPLGAQAQDVMRCGGCGAKVGPAVLARVLERLTPKPRDGSAVGLAEPDDAAVIEPRPGQLQVQSVDMFRAFIADPYLFGRIAANHALGDIYAMGGEPDTAMAIALVPHGPDAKVEDEVFQMLKGGLEVIEAAGARLVGGHTGEALEATLGFSVTGSVPANRLLRKSGLQPGDALILTKALGTGVVLAGDMRGRTRSPWLDAALAAMQVSQRQAARCLIEHEASAMTDVTGFGLAAHLLEMLRASGMDGALELAHLPHLPGAVELLAQGIESTLAPSNAGSAGASLANGHPHDPSRLRLLYDPQTAGGLLAGVPAGQAPSCIDALVRLGYGDAAIIGHVVAMSAGAPSLRLA